MKTKNNLAQWLADPRAEKYFGQTFAMRSDALVWLLTGKPLQREIAARHQCSRTAVTMAATRAKNIFGIAKRHAG